MTALVLASLSIVSSPSAPDSAAILARSWDQTLVVGHRGAAAYLPENTVASFDLAAEVGAHATECDVHMSADGVPFILHDATLDRTTSLKGRIDATDAATLRAAGVPALEDVMIRLKNRIVFVIEIKAGKGVEKAVVDLVKKHGTERQTIVFSFNHAIVTEIERLHPALPTVWLQGTAPTPDTIATVLDRRKEAGIDAIGVSYRVLQPFFAERLRAERIPLFVWTVPPGPEIDRLKALRVNFIITDHPRDVLAQLAAK